MFHRIIRLENRATTVIAVRDTEMAKISSQAINFIKNKCPKVWGFIAGQGQAHRIRRDSYCLVISMCLLDLV